MVMDIVERLRNYDIDCHCVERPDPTVMEAANEIERLREENQKQRERIMLLNSMIQTEHKIIRVAALREGE